VFRNTRYHGVEYHHEKAGQLQ